MEFNYVHSIFLFCHFSIVVYKYGDWVENCIWGHGRKYVEAMRNGGGTICIAFGKSNGKLVLLCIQQASIIYANVSVCAVEVEVY